ncbi:hypothetical protein DsansV1_C09g0093861 [Dioscorea sansibarensis]
MRLTSSIHQTDKPNQLLFIDKFLTLRKRYKITGPQALMQGRTRTGQRCPIHQLNHILNFLHL